jgi:hypothetical protein
MQHERARVAKFPAIVEGRIIGANDLGGASLRRALMYPADSRGGAPWIETVRRSRPSWTGCKTD